MSACAKPASRCGVGLPPRCAQRAPPAKAVVLRRSSARPHQTCVTRHLSATLTPHSSLRSPEASTHSTHWRLLDSSSATAAAGASHVGLLPDARGGSSPSRSCGTGGSACASFSGKVHHFQHVSRLLRAALVQSGTQVLLPSAARVPDDVHCRCALFVLVRRLR